MNTILAVPNWSIFDPLLVDKVASKIAERCFVHFAQGDIDHGRTVTAFSGAEESVFESMFVAAQSFLPRIDLRENQGVHPASGALDVAPFVMLEGSEERLIERCRIFARTFSDEFAIPTHLYEKAVIPGSETSLPVLRGQTKKQIPKPFVDRPQHLQWGQTITGVRNFLVAANINLNSTDLALGKQFARDIRRMREQGDSRFVGVRALAFWLQSRQLVQMSFNFTQPDDASFDFIYEYLLEQGVPILETELIGVIRDVDLPRSTRLRINPEQIVKSVKL
jgi:glutamate formiminotransferase